MSLFVCQQCRAIENTVLSRFWFRYEHGGGTALCSECDPEIGKWHGIFPKRIYTGVENVGWVDGEWVESGSRPGQGG